jgi:hypothetical protein
MFVLRVADGNRLVEDIGRTKKRVIDGFFTVFASEFCFGSWGLVV